MQTPAVAAPAAPKSLSSALGGGKAAGAQPQQQQFDYMKLIVAQMQNLNPMDPSSGGDSLPTMMQAESLNQLVKLNQALTDLQTMTQTSYASSLIGRDVSGIDESNATISGTVTGIEVDASGPVLKLSTGKQLRLLDITSVQQP
jgi:flagellar basal-body rod modification protein FlgD